MPTTKLLVAVAVVKLHLGRFLALQELQEFLGRVLILALLQKHGVLSDLAIEFSRNDPAGTEVILPFL